MFVCEMKIRFEEAYRTAANEYDNAVLVLSKAEHTMAQQECERLRRVVELAGIALSTARLAYDARPLTDDVADDTRPSISPDGRLLAYNSNRTGNWYIWLKDLPSGREMA